MTTSRWERAKEIFDTALDLQPDARPSYLRQTCGDDSELQHEVEGLLAADAEAGSFMNPGWHTPFSPEQDFQLTPGDVVSGRFKIVRPLGHGGMGRVYEAHDSVLGVQVALKTLRPEISANSEVLFRFRQEVRIAHRITHPNVCRTYHLDHEIRKIGDDESSSVDLTFLTMEFLEGETLQQLLKRCGRIPLERALVIARQIAEAIEAAHQIGVIHRDIKPGNVMICPSMSGEDRVVITDFGLAKFEAGAAHNDHSSISQPGRAMGTLSYMSPEQLKGEEVGPATDIYAFGLILYEMVTGAKAFQDSATMATAYRRTLEPPPSPGAVTPGLPSAWETAILGCLQIDPAARFHTATDVVEILEGSMPHSSRLRSLQRTRTNRRTVSRSNTVAIGLAVAVVVALLAIVSRYFFTREGSTVAPGTLVYLAPVKNETGEKQLDNVTELVRAGLEQSAHIKLLDAGRVGDTLQQMTKAPDVAIDAPTAREIAMRVKAGRVIFATVTGGGNSNRYRLSMDIQQPDTEPLRYRKHWLKEWDWTAAKATANSDSIAPDLLDAVRDASGWVRRTVGEPADDLSQLDVGPQDVTTPSWEALTAYNRAQALATAGKNESAVDALKEAIKFDPDFALAYARLGDILFALHQNNEGLSAYLKALSTGANHRLSRRERDRIKAMYAIDTCDYEAADLALRDSISFYENDPLSWAYRVQPLIMLGRNEDAIETLNKVLEFNPRSSFGLSELANTYMGMGRYDDAAKTIEKVRGNGYTDYATELDAHLYFLEGHLDEAKFSMLMLGSSKIPELRIKSLPLLARLRAERGDYAAALLYLNESVANGENATRHGFLATVLLDRALIRERLGDNAGMLADVRSALKISPVSQNWIAASRLLGQANVGANSEWQRKIQQALTEILNSIPAEDAGMDTDLARLLLQGEVKLSGHDWKAALELFRKAVNVDAPAGIHEYLGRALNVAARHESDPMMRKNMEREALETFATVARRPGFIWRHPLESPPGAYTDGVQAYFELSARTGARTEDIPTPGPELHRIRLLSAAAFQSPQQKQAAPQHPH